MLQQFQTQVKWAFQSETIWVLGMHDPIPAKLMLWLTQNFRILGYQVLESGTIAIRVVASAQQMPILKKLPSASGGGSLHECNWIVW